MNAAELIKYADIVVYDRLVSKEIRSLIPPDAMTYDVGKESGNHILCQTDINRLLVHLAASGKDVIRLKGGDPFIFGRGGEEILWLRSHGIPCRTVPGITAAIGCSASTGIPLTHRKLSTSVQFITGRSCHEQPHLSRLNMKDPQQTLVFYMGIAECASIKHTLLSQGRSPKTPVAIIEQGTRKEERVMICTLEELDTTVLTQIPRSPSVIIIGDVASLYRPTTEEHDIATGRMISSTHYCGAIPY